VPYFFKCIGFTVAYHTWLHFSMTTGIGFSSGISMQMNPRIDAKGFAIF
jgi:hypothetical protein